MNSSGTSINIDKQALNQTLLNETVKLFSLMAKADGQVTAEEEAYVHQYFETLYPEELAVYLGQEFSTHVRGQLDQQAVVRSLKERLAYEEKIFLLTKLYELMAADEIDEQEMQLLQTISREMGVAETDLITLGNIMRPEESTHLPEDATAAIRCLRISDDPDGPVTFPFDGLSLLLLRVNRRLILIQQDDKHSLRLGNLKLSPHFSRLMRQEQSIRINDSYTLTYQDLKFYYKHLTAPIRSCYLIHAGQDYQVSEKNGPKAFLQLRLDGCKIFLRSLHENERLRVNGQTVHDWAAVNLDDLVLAGHLLINIRTLVIHPLLERELLSLAGGNAQYQIGNQFEHDITIDDDLDRKWSCPIEVQAQEGTYLLHIEECPYQVYVNNQLIRKNPIIHRDDYIRINNHIIFWNEEGKHFEKVGAGFSRLTAQGLSFAFRDKTLGVDDVSFEVQRGELVGILGPSGSGKSTLINLMNGLYAPQQGRVMIDNFDLHEQYDRLKDFIGYVPQDDLLFENLTVHENLYFNARLRYPSGKRNVHSFVNKVLRDIGLYKKRDDRVGSPLHKVLSGGERKRVNIGLELLSESDILFLDEPTSGLSSKDSEKILSLIRELAFRGKIIFVVIHQPSARLYKMFNKIILLDRGGRLAFFGNGYQALDYFKSFSEDVDHDIDFSQPQNLDPDLLLDTLEQPLKDIDGTPLPVRKYSPAFWQDRFRTYQSSQKVSEIPERVDSFGIPETPPRSWKERMIQFQTLFIRNFTNKLRDRSNLVITFLIPPLLGLIVGAILRYSPLGEGQPYSLYHNLHLVTYLFLAVLIAIFLGMTNSVEEIIRDQRILLRERMLHLSHHAYFASKYLSLLIFAMIQNVLFLLASFPLLGLRELPIYYFVVLTLVSATGLAIGLFISSLPGLSSKAAVNIVPIILVPQIIFGGALVKYKEMNQQLTFFEDSPIPEVCQIMPSRWGFEALVSLQGTQNSFHPTENALQYRLDDHRYARKKLLARYKAEGGNPKAAENRFAAELDSMQQEVDQFRLEKQDPYGNRAVEQALKSGEFELKSLLKEGKPSLYPLFIPQKQFFGLSLPTYAYNGFILLLMVVLLNLVTLSILRIRFR